MRAAAPASRIAVTILICSVALGGCATRADPSLGSTSTMDIGEPRAGGVLRLGVVAPMVVDPVEVNPASPAEMLVLDLLHDGLTRVDADGTVVPALARSWTANDSFTDWSFSLDPDATFSDGSPITSAEVVASLQRVAATGDRSLAARPLEAVAGYRAFVDGATQSLEGLSAPDARTVAVRLDRPLNVLPVVLSGPLYGVVHPEVTAALTPSGAPLSGSWAVEAADGPVHTFARRPGAPGHLDRLELRAYSAPDRAYRAFEEGDVDWALVPAAQHRRAAARFGDDAVAPFHAEVFLGMGVRGGPLADPALRQAIQAAIDARTIVRRVYGRRAEVLGTIIPEGVPGYAAERCGTCGHDPARAEELLAAAFPDGAVPEVILDFDTSATQDELAELVAADLEAVGIPVTLRPRPLAEYQGFLASGEPQLFSAGWIGGYRSAAAYLYPLFQSTANDNLTGYRSEPVDVALATALSTTDEKLAAFQLAEVERTVLEQAVVVPLAQFRTLAVVGERVRGLVHAVDGSVDWAEVWVTDTLPNSTSGRGGTGRRAALRSLWE